MIRLITGTLCILLLVLPDGAISAERELTRDILGIRLAMPKDVVQKRLQEIGKFVRDERKRQQIWEVRDSSFSHVIVGFDANDRLRYVTAVAREDAEAKRIKYADIGDTEAARQAGDVAIKNFNYEWTLSASKENTAGLVIARGRDPEFLSTYSLKALAAEGGEQDSE
jgi:hypothetical protein